ncbi:unnamed protein product [Rotaria sp. Silwood2]|nr:unnamed protein product [Rotaria sp. Silwood2]
MSITSSSSAISFLASNKGYRLLVQDRFMYKLNKQTSSKMYWICKIKNCKAHVHTDLNNNFLKSSGEHNHLLEPEDIQVKQFLNIVKDRVIKETASISKIYDEEVSKAAFSTELLASIPLARDIQPALNRARRKLTPILPGSATFDIPDSYQITSKDEKFLFRDTLISLRKRMLLFGSPKQLEVLFDSSSILMGGTFSATPPFFDQLFTLHALKFECYRKKSTYQQLFQVLKDMAASMNRIFKPERIISDFESSLVSIIPAKFPQAVHQDCYFHYTQAIYRRIQSLGLSTAYSQDEEIRYCCRKLMAIALLPIEEVENSYYNLRSTSSTKVKEELRQLFMYFDSYWRNDLLLKLWNVHGCQYRTNNNCEGIHRFSFLNVAYDPYV